MREIKVEKSYVSGVGKISFGVGVCDSTETPFLSVGNINGKYRNVGDDLNERDVEKKPMTLIYFKNLEGLEVLEHMIKKVKLILIEQNERRR